MLPYYPTQGSTGGHQYEVTTWWRRIVSEYTGLSIPQVGDLNWITYLTYRRDAFIYLLEGSEAGREYLRNAWRMEQTEPDRAALRRKFGKKEGRVNGNQ